MFVIGELEKAKCAIEEEVSQLKVQHQDEEETLKTQHTKAMGALEQRLKLEATQQVDKGIVY